MKITFYHYEDEDITINTDAILEDGKLILDGLDYGKRVEELRGMGDDYEYKLSLDKENTTKLFDSLGVADKTDKQKLATMKEKFGKDRNEVFKKLYEHDIYARKYFYPAINDLECYRSPEQRMTPIAHDVSLNILTLPIYEGLAMEDVDRICEIILGS